MKKLHLLMTMVVSVLIFNVYAKTGLATVVTSGETIVFDTNSLTCMIDGVQSVTGTVDQITSDAVFQFDSLDIQNGAVVTISGPRTIVLESLGAITLDTIIDISAEDVNDAPLWMTNTGGAGGPAGGFAGGDWRQDGHGPGFGRYVVNAGSGAGYGGAGGRNGRTETGVGQAYGNEQITYLYGGSGGGGGNEQYFASVGGGGGGGIGLTAGSDMIIGSNGGILAEGATVESLSRQLNGGGGSGGSIRLIANGTITVNGILSANGGKGGDISIEWGETSSPNTKTGGGGAGGRIAFYSADGTVSGSGTITATGGEPGYYYGYENSPDGDLAAEAGQDGTIAYFSEPYIPPLPTIENPTPTDGVLEVPADISLTWEVTGKFASYDIYFSDDEEAVENETVSPINVTEPVVASSSLPELQRGTWYYWKIVGHITAGGDVIKTDVLSLKTETYKIEFDIDALTYTSEDGENGRGLLFNFYHSEPDPNNPDISVAKFVFSDFTYGSQWEIRATGQYPLWIESTGDISFGGVANLAGYSPRPLDPRLNPAVAEPNLILGGYPGGYRGDSTYTPPAIGHGPGGGESHRHGGGGGGYGGAGGQGDIDSELLGYGGHTYGNDNLHYLLGGSGGGAADASTGACGGSALALVAAGNIDISRTAELIVDGGMGSDDSKGRGRLTGAGGSGGSLLIVANGTVNIDGLVSAQGGDAYPCPAGQDEAGGGGGGRIAIYSVDGTYTGNGTITVAGGKSGKNEFSTSPAEDGQPGTVFVGTNYPLAIGSLVVDDFESYNDIPSGEEGSNLVYDTWVDGYANPAANGSTIGYVQGSSLETMTVHSGKHSVALTYDNTTAPVSEVTANTDNLPIGNDWAAVNPEKLVLWIYGDPGNSSSGQLYVKINGIMSTHQGDLKQTSWQQVTIDLTDLGIDLSNVTTLGIGIDGAGAKGRLLMDDIRLYAPSPDAN
jgi:hypothetical protein